MPVNGDQLQWAVREGDEGGDEQLSSSSSSSVHSAAHKGGMLLGTAAAKGSPTPRPPSPGLVVDPEEVRKAWFDGSGGGGGDCVVLSSGQVKLPGLDGEGGGRVTRSFGDDPALVRESESKGYKEGEFFLRLTHVYTVVCVCACACASAAARVV